ncbi:FMN-binding protein [Gordonia sp. NPDC003425]
MNHPKRTSSRDETAAAGVLRDRVGLARTGGVVAAVAAIGLATAACGSDDAGDTGSTSAQATQTTTAAGGGASATDTASGTFKNGEYSATGYYVSPGGPQEIGVTVTLSNSVITALSLDTSNTRGTSKEYQGKFASGIDPLVIGKNIDELNVSKVSGSSLTSGGFNDAIDQIKNEARS